MDDSLRVEIERYLAGGMTPEETETFLARVQADPEALAWLGRGLEDQAYLFDAARALPRRASRPRRFRSWLASETRAPIGLIAAVAAAALLLVVGIALSGRPRRPEPASPQPMAVELPAPAPESPRPTPRPEPDAPRPAPAPKVEAPAVPLPAPTPVPPAPPPEAPKPPKVEEPSAPRETKVATPAPPPVGTLEKAVGDVSAPPGPLVAGQAVRTGPKSSAVFRLRRTAVEMSESTLVEELSEGRARLRLSEGSIAVDVTPGLQDPVVLLTKHAEVTVLGTRFRLTVAGEGTRLEVTQGRVRIQRLSDRSAVEVRAGHFAVAGTGELAARPVPIDDIVLLPVHGAIGGGDWRIAVDPDASSGRVFEAPKVGQWAKPNTTGDTSRVTFTFRADADRDYHVWVRGKALATEKQIERDAIILDFAQAAVTERPGVNKGVAGGPERALFNGYSHATGYWWVGGDADGKNDEIPVVVRFARPGLQTVRMFAYETPVRIDAIWISATQKSRPEPSSSGPR